MHILLILILCLVSYFSYMFAKNVNEVLSKKNIKIVNNRINYMFFMHNPTKDNVFIG